MIQIIHIWNEIIAIGYKIRFIMTENNKSKEILDNRGKETWNALKVIIGNTLSNHDCSFSWNSRCLMFYDEILALGINDDNLETSNGNERFIKEQFHFIIQHGRIPTQTPSIIKLLQIAYNCGQSQCHNYNTDISNYYFSNKLDDIETYVSSVC